MNAKSNQVPSSATPRETAKEPRPTVRRPLRVPKPKKLKQLWNPQESLFDENGFAPFNPQTDAHPVKDQPGKVMVGGMLIVPHPLPKDLIFALKLTMDSMAVLHYSKGCRTYHRPMVPGPMRLDSWMCSKCTVSFRERVDDGAIHATYSRPGDHLALSIPHMKMWKACGLHWLWQDSDCSKCNVNNPTPWRPRACSCL